MDFNQRADQIIKEIRTDHIVRMALFNEQYLPFNEGYFLSKLESICQSAGRGCGCSYEIYVSKVSEAIAAYLHTLSESIQPHVLEMAIRRFDYPDPDRDEELAECGDEDDGYCRHGFPDNCCPLGCDDL